MKKPFYLQPGDDPAKYAPCDIVLSMEDEPIENHPRFSKPDVRFRHARTRKNFAKLKASGVNYYLVPRMRIIPR